jgi:Cupin domain
VVAPGDGELLTDEARRRVEVKADREELAITSPATRRARAAGCAFPPRTHCFFVLEGRLMFELEGERIEANAGDFVAVPPLVVHTFRNEGPGDARFLNLLAPSKGFVQRRDGGDPERFDTFDPSQR